MDRTRVVRSEEEELELKTLQRGHKRARARKQRKAAAGEREAGAVAASSSTSSSSCESLPDEGQLARLERRREPKIVWLVQSDIFAGVFHV